MKNIKKILAGFLAVALIATGLYIVPQEAEEVKATETASSTDVNKDMLNVKFQTAQTKETEGDNAGKYVMRFIASVDSLDYSAVGFEVTSSEGTAGYNDSVVFERIDSKDDNVSYEFSPKVVDTSSEYFVTARMYATPGVNYTIRAYVVSLDGTTTTYGGYRCVSAEDGLNGVTTTNVSFVETAENTYSVSETPVTVSSSCSKGTQATVFAKNGTTVHARINVAPSELPSATKFTFESGETVINRNLYTTHIPTSGTTPVADKTWYEVDTSAKEFVIATGADLYGLADIVDAGTQLFANKTIYVVSDIAINSKSDKTYAWDPIGTASVSFKGNFDGQMHQISGIHVNTEKGVGLFGSADTGTLSNIKLADSTFTGTGTGTAYVGSLAGFIGGHLNTIYVASDVTVTSAGQEIGGIVGRVTGNRKHTITNCQFSGSVSTEQYYVGGIIGKIHLGQVTMMNCLNKGNVTNMSATGNSNIAWTGGLLGAIQVGETGYTVTLVMEECLNTGVVRAQENVVGGLGSVIGRVRASTSFENVYTTDDVKAGDAAPDKSSAVNGVGNYSKDKVTSGEVVIKEETELSGAQARYNTALDFYTNKQNDGYWMAKEAATPELKDFVEIEDYYLQDETIVADTEWYDANTTAREFTISTTAEFVGLSKVAETDNFAGDVIRLAGDIMLNNGTASEWAENEPVNAWTSIGNNSSGVNTKNFEGVFDGDGHTIEGVYVKGTVEGNYYGLFACAQGSTCEIKDFKLLNSYFTSILVGTASSQKLARIGSIAGRGNAKFDSIYSDAIIDAETLNAVGGLVAMVTDYKTPNVFDECEFAGEMSFYIYGGGVVGYVTNQDTTLTITNCKSSGVINCATNNVGGICGTLSDNNETTRNVTLYMSDCVSTGTITTGSPSVVGSVLGRVRAGAKAVLDNIYTTDTISTAAGDSVTHQGVYNGVANNSPGNIVANSSSIKVINDATECILDSAIWKTNSTNLPKLQLFEDDQAIVENKLVADISWYDESENAFEIATPEQLLGLAQLSQTNSFEGVTFTLTQNITLNTGNAQTWERKAPINEWTAIGNSTYPFKGVFDGKGKTISGLYMNTTNDYSGMFSYIRGESCEVKNFRLVNSFFTYRGTDPDARMGSIIGDANAKVESIYSEAIMYMPTMYIVGGIVGQVSTGTTTQVNKCQFAGEITDYQYAAGIVGYVIGANTQLSINDCLNTGSIYCGMNNAGGICGSLGDADNRSITLNITDCVFAGYINTYGSHVVGSLISRVRTGSTAVITDVYTTHNIITSMGAANSQGTHIGIGNNSPGTIQGTTTQISDTTTFNLDTSIWTIGADNVPYLTQFAQ